MVKKDPKWFKKFKKDRTFKKAINKIDLAKFCYERDFQLPQWFLGTGMVVFLSVNLGKVLQSTNKLIYWSGFIAYFLSIILLFVGMIMLIIINHRHKKAMIHLYKLKDKQERR